MRSNLSAAFRRTGADLPGGDPRPTHGAEMEGWFWRITDVPAGVVAIALCGINNREWATVAIAAHPFGVTYSDAVTPALASPDTYVVEAGRALLADERRLHACVGDAELDVTFDELAGWPLRLGAGGVFSALPWLGQYWHPHVLGGRATGTLRVGDATHSFSGAQVYAEKNWGAGFPEYWWWGQAQGFTDPELCVAFGGGRLRAGPVGADVTGCVVRTRERTLRFAPPFAVVRKRVDGETWHVEARKPRWKVTIDGDSAGHDPFVLPVPIPAEHRNVDHDFEHLAGRMRVVVEHNGVRVLEDESHLAGLEIGSVDPAQLPAHRVDVFSRERLAT
ncbi:MAG: tocopherol cyclase [Actinomycetota bacterium]